MQHEVPGAPAPFVPVPGVAAFLRGVVRRRVSQVVAPAGTGKTALATTWVASVADTVDVEWRGTVPADARQDGARPRRRTKPPHAAPLPGHGTRVVVVDDADLLGTEDRAALELELEAGKDGTHFLLLSRHDIPVVPVALELSGDAQTLRFPELRLDDRTAADLVVAHHPSATAEQVAELVERSGGWAAALALGARSLHGAAPTPPLSRMPQHPILDFVVSELVAELPDALVGVLAATCWQPDFTDEDAVVLSGDPGAPDELATAAAEGLVVDRARGVTDPRSDRWRMHPIVGEALRRRSAPGGPDRAAVVLGHERALRHHERTGDLAAALHQATLTGDPAIQLTTIAHHAFDLIAHDRVAPVLDALAHLPPQLRQSDRGIQALDAFVLRGSGRWEDAKRLADLVLAPSAPGSEPGPGSEDAALETDLAILDVWQARCGARPIRPALARASAALGCQHDADPRSSVTTRPAAPPSGPDG